MVADEPGAGGAHHVYDVYYQPPAKEAQPVLLQRVAFQNGPILEKGVNAPGHEEYLAILIDRLESFQKGPFPCEENKQALNHLRIALEYLHTRTIARIKRGVEGKTKA